MQRPSACSACKAGEGALFGGVVVQARAHGQLVCRLRLVHRKSLQQMALLPSCTPAGVPAWPQACIIPTSFKC